MNPTCIEDLLILHEGSRDRPYRDTVGKLTIGVGRNLDDVGILDHERELLEIPAVPNEELCLTEAQIRGLLGFDIDRARAGLIKTYPWYLSLDPTRRDVLTDMCFNMGIGKLGGFKKTLALTQCKDFHGASVEMLASSWAAQVGERARRLARMMETGEY